VYVSGKRAVYIEHPVSRVLRIISSCLRVCVAVSAVCQKRVRALRLRIARTGPIRGNAAQRSATRGATRLTVEVRATSLAVVAGGVCVCVRVYVRWCGLRARFLAAGVRAGRRDRNACCSPPSRLSASPLARVVVRPLSLTRSLTRTFARVVARPLLVNSYGELLIRGGVCVRKNRRWLEERKVGGRGRGREIDG